VLLTPDGPQVTDAGLARAAAATPLTRGGALVGTLGYLAPEQVVDGVAVPASDVFALGSVLLFAATWRRPFGDCDAIAVLHRVLHGDPDLGGLSPDVATVVAACLHPDPERRPGLAQVRETLRAAAADDGDEIHPAASVAPAPISGPKHRPLPVAVPAPRRPLSAAHRIASAAAVSATLVGLLAVTSADTTLAPDAPFGLHLGR
jgi:eukaryotic-like serine/threonine-protein kinase